MEQQIKITLESKEGKIEIIFNNSDVGLDQYYQALKSMLIFMTFNESTIDAYINEIAKELNDD